MGRAAAACHLAGQRRVNQRARARRSSVSGKDGGFDPATATQYTVLIQGKIQKLISENDDTGMLQRLYDAWETKFHNPGKHIAYLRKPTLRQKMGQLGSSFFGAADNRPAWTFDSKHL